jgi:hypothetical protein
MFWLAIKAIFLVSVLCTAIFFITAKPDPNDPDFQKLNNEE